MAEEADRESKTEEPTEKKVEDALRKGNTPHAREPAVLAALLAMLAVAAFIIGPGALALTQRLSAFIERPEQWRLDDAAGAMSLMQLVAGQAALFLLPILALFVVATITANFVQGFPRVAWERIRPQLSRISLKKGLQRILGAPGWVEFAKALFKFAAVSAVVAVMLKAETTRVIETALTAPQALPSVVLALTMKLLSTVAIVALLLAIADIAWSRRYWWSNLRMTKQEVKDEHKELEGDPIVKARRLSLAREQLRRSMLNAVPQARVVIANPTHFAVALRYDEERDPAPMVVAKGQDLLALRIREIAERHGVPVIENKSLARALHAQAEVGQLIPEEFYPAVAEIIHYLMTQEEKRRAWGRVTGA